MKNLAKALLKSQQTMGVALKDAKNPFFKSKYADLNAIIDAAIPTLNDNGVLVVQPTVVLDGKQYVKTTLIHAESGESLESFTAVVVKSENDAQQIGSGISYARRYGLQSLVVLKAEDDDGNVASNKSVNQSKLEEAPLATRSGGAAVTNAGKPDVESKNVTVENNPPPFRRSPARTARKETRVDDGI